MRADLGGVITEIPRLSPHSITVPGACSAMLDTITKYGNGKLSLKEIFNPAIELAENGFPVSEITAEAVSFYYFFIFILLIAILVVETE